MKFRIYAANYGKENSNVMLRDRKRTECIREQAQASGILVQIKKKKCRELRAFIALVTDSRQFLRAMEWIPGEGKCSEGLQRGNWHK